MGLRPYGKQTYLRNPDTGKRQAFINPEEKQADVIKVPELRILSVELWERVKARQASLARSPKLQSPALPFFAQQRPRYLRTGTMTCGSCGAGYARSGKEPVRLQGAAKKGPTWCDNRLTIRQGDLDAFVLTGLSTEMMRDDVVAAFLT